MNSFWKSFKIPLLFNIIILLTLGVNFIVSYSNQYKKVDDSIVKKYNKTLVSRNIAESTKNGFECVKQKNTLNLEYIKSQITELEYPRLSNQIIKGKVKGLDLSKLPYPQASFLKKYQKSFGKDDTTSEIFSNCETVMCATNIINKDPTFNLYGYLHYYIYLKAGVFLNLSNSIPGQHSPIPGIYERVKRDFKDYLFTKEEIIRFYKLVRALPKTYLENERFQRIYRIPIDHFEVKLGKKLKNACGTAYSMGWVSLTTKCMSVSRFALDGFFMNTAHEVSHQKDYTHLQTTRYSLRKSWLDNAGWKKEPFYDKVNNVNKTRWTHTLPDEDFVTDYAQKSPGEHFAESMAAYRFGIPFSSRKFHPETYKYLKKEFFADREYSPLGLLKTYSKFIEDDWDKKISHHTLNCVSKSEVKNIESTLKCIKNETINYKSQYPDKIRSEFFDGCRFLSDDKYLLMASDLKTNIDLYLNSSLTLTKHDFETYGQELVRSLEIQIEFIKNTDPISIYLQCNDSLGKKKCYEDILNQTIKSYLEDKNLSESLRIKTKNNILTKFTFESVDKSIKYKSQNLLESFQNYLSLRVNQSWFDCKDSSFDFPDNLITPLLFDGGDKFVVSNFLNCVNEHVKDDIDIVLEKPIDDLKLNTYEKKYFSNKLEKYSINLLNTFLESEYNHEVLQNNSYFEFQKARTIQRVKESLDISNIEPESISQSCLDLVYSDYPKNNFFHSTKMFDALYGVSICSDVLRDMKDKITSSYRKKWPKILKYYQGLALLKVTKSITKCRQKSPLVLGPTFYMSKIKLNRCIDTLPSKLESEVMSIWDGSAESEYLNKRSIIRLEIENIILDEILKTKVKTKRTLKF
jgi:hypothetical protein